MQTKDELRLVKLAQSGDRDALARLWDEITPKLYGYLVNVLRDKNVADDVLQNTWLSAIKGLNTFKPRGIRFSAWVFAIARNECKQYWRSSGGQKAEIPLDGHEDEKHAGMSENIGNQLYIESILQKLSEEDREILRLKYIAGLSFLEIAKVLAISIVAARVRAHRAVVRAREFVKN